MLSLNPFQSNLTEPWRCSHCKILVYNVVLDPEGQRWVPDPGAPLRADHHPDYGDLCQTCADLLAVIADNKYMADLNKAYRKQVEESKEKAKRLGRNLSDGTPGTAL